MHQPIFNLAIPVSQLLMLLSLPGTPDRDSPDGNVLGIPTRCIATSYWGYGIFNRKNKCLSNSLRCFLTRPRSLIEISLLLFFFQQAINVVLIPDGCTPALVQSIGPTKLDVSLPSSITESFSFVFETNAFSLDAILPKYNETDPLVDENEDGTFISSSPVSGLFTLEANFERKSKLYGITHLSAWVRSFSFSLNNVVNSLASSSCFTFW